MGKFQIGPFRVKFAFDPYHRQRLFLRPGFKDIREQTNYSRTKQQRARHCPPKEIQHMASFQMPDSQQVTMTIAYADKRGNPVPAPAGAQAPLWQTDNSDLLSLLPAADGMSCTVVAMGPLGHGVVSVSVADGSGNPLAAGSIDVTIVSGAPATIAITPGTPSEQ